MGRPQKAIDENMIVALATIGCSAEEIASIVGCSKTTLYRRFGTVIEKGHAQQKTSLRRMQWAAAQSGNTSMLIWLGKQYLGQREPRDVVAPPQGDSGTDIATARKAIQEHLRNDPSYGDYLRNRNGESNGHAGPVRANGQRREVDNGAAPQGN